MRSFALPAFCQVLPRLFPPCFDASRPDPTLPPLAGKLTAGACWLSTKIMVHVSRDAGTHLVPGNGKPLRFCQECRWSTCAHPRSALLAAFFPPPLQVLPVVVPPSSAMLVLCRWDQQRTADQLRSFPTQTDPAWGRRNERRLSAVQPPSPGKNSWKWRPSQHRRSLPASLLLLEPALPVKASRRFASCCFHSSRQNWSRSSQRTVACLQRDKEESLLL